VVVGGQFGSEAKGHIAGYLARQDDAHEEVAAIRVAGPNAGHSVVHPQTGVKYALRQIPAAAVTNPEATLIIAPGSEVDIQVLTDEIHRLEGDGIKVRERLFIDGAATFLKPHHLIAESEAELSRKIGSTGKGVGAARADRIMRSAATVCQHKVMFSQWGTVESTGPLLRSLQSDPGMLVQVEGTQGYGLGLHTHFYPKVTSSDCTALSFLAMAGINPWYSVNGAPWSKLEIWVVSWTMGSTPGRDGGRGQRRTRRTGPASPDHG
jgi:adenylosuccinate synthase